MLNHQDLMARGLAKLNEIDGEQGDKVMQALADISPDLGKYIIGFAFGEIYQRPQLDLRQRELVTLAALAAQGGCENQLRVHIHASLNVGLTRDEIVRRRCLRRRSDAGCLKPKGYLKGSFGGAKMRKSSLHIWKTKCRLLLYV